MTKEKWKIKHEWMKLLKIYKTIWGDNMMNQQTKDSEERRMIQMKSMW